MNTILMTNHLKKYVINGHSFILPKEYHGCIRKEGQYIYLFVCVCNLHVEIMCF